MKSRMQFEEFNKALIVVTGAAQGIGLCVAERLADLGATVISLDKAFDYIPFEEVLSDSRNVLPSEKVNEAGRIIPLHVDVNSPDDLAQIFECVERRIGPIRYLVHAAAILKQGMLTELPYADWIHTIQTNVSGTFNVCTSIAKRMKIQRQGSIVLVGSNASSTPRIGLGAYAASKAASTMLLKCLGLELAEFNIRCNIVAPGSTDTAMQRQLWTKADSEKKVIEGDLSQYRLGIPLKRIATPDQIAQCVLFLLSDSASHITMETLKVDAGATLGGF